MRIHVQAHARESTSRIEDDTKQWGVSSAVLDLAGPFGYGAEYEITTLQLSVLLPMLLFSLLLLLLSLLLQLLIVVAASRCRCRSCLCEGYDMRLHRSNEDDKSMHMSKDDAKTDGHCSHL